MTRSSRWLALLAASTIWIAAPASAVTPDGHMTWGIHASLAPAWFDPAETTGISTPFMVLYALHGALVKPMPGQAMTPSLAESWTVSRDGLTYEFVLRKGAMFHNGDPVSAEDVKFSFERYASFNPGIELVLEAYEAYWRKTPSVKRLVFKSVPTSPRAWRCSSAARRTSFDAGEIVSDIVYVPIVEAVVNFLQAAGIRTKLRGLERASFQKSDQEKKLKRARVGNAATRIEAFVVSTGSRAYGGFPDIDGLYQEQAGELDPKRRAAILQKIQQFMHERVVFAPLVEPALLNGYGPRVADRAWASSPATSTRRRTRT